MLHAGAQAWGRVSIMGAQQELSLPTQTIMPCYLTVKDKWMYTEGMRVMITLVETRYLALGEAGHIETVGTLPLQQFDAAFDASAKMAGPCLRAIIVP